MLKYNSMVPWTTCQPSNVISVG